MKTAKAVYEGIKWLREPTFDEDGVQASSGLDRSSKEHPDPVPMSVPIGMTSSGDSVHHALRDIVRQELFRQAVESEDYGSFEEEDDFDIEDDEIDPHTPYEAVFDPPPPPPAAPPVAPAAVAEFVAGASPGPTTAAPTAAVVPPAKPSPGGVVSA